MNLPVALGDLAQVAAIEIGFVKMLKTGLIADEPDMFRRGVPPRVRALDPAVVGLMIDRM